MSYKIICPYCKIETEVDTDEQNELIYSETEFTSECKNCGKIVIVEPHVTVRLKARKCKCQGEKHKWLESITFPKCLTEMVCEYCGERRPMTDKEREAFNIPSVKEYLDFLNKDA